MRCYRHADREAIALCKHCTKGICAECAMDGEGGTACSDACASQIAVAHALLLRARATLQFGRAQLVLPSVFLMICGLGLIAFALQADPRIRLLPLGAGVIFALCGLGLYLVWRHFRARGA